MKTKITELLQIEVPIIQGGMYAERSVRQERSRISPLE